MASLPKVSHEDRDYLEMAVEESSSLEKPNSKEGEFRRIEDKYLLSESEAEFIQKIVLSHMHPSYLEENVDYTLIESIYFDSPHLDFFRHHMESRSDRYKMRLRHYGPNGIWSKYDNYLLEIKRKQDGVTKKKRFMIPETIFDEIKNGGLIPYPLTREVRDVNSEVTPGKLVKRVNLANDLISNYSLRPKLIVQYKRHAYEDETGKFRVTFDQDILGDHLGLVDAKDIKDIQHQPYWERVVRFGSKLNESTVIMEIKHLEDGVPSWMEELLKQLGKTKSSFSKYCYFTAKSVLDNEKIVQRS